MITRVSYLMLIGFPFAIVLTRLNHFSALLVSSGLFACRMVALFVLRVFRGSAFIRRTAKEAKLTQVVDQVPVSCFPFLFVCDSVWVSGFKSSAPKNWNH